jgi:glycogen(starch) synthase
MKILMVSELAPYPILGGLALHAITLGNHFIKAGHDVDFLCNARYTDKANIEQMGFKGRTLTDKRVDKGIWLGRIERKGGVYNYPFHNHISHRIATAIERIGLHYDAIHYHGHYSTVAHHVSQDINLVVTHHDYSIVCPQKILLNSSQEVCDSHGHSGCSHCFNANPNVLQSLFSDEGCRKWRNDARIALQKHKHIFVSKRVQELILGVLNIKSARNHHVIHNFIDCDKIQKIVAKLSMKSDHNKSVENFILLAGTIAPFKGTRRFLECLMNRKGNPSSRVIIVGDGSEKRNLQDLYRASYIEFTGWLPYSETIGYMMRAGTYVLPSISEESCSTSVLEALYLGKHVKALRRGGTPELAQYAYDLNQLKIYNTMDGLIEELGKQDDTRGIDPIPPEDFGASVDKKALDIQRVYTAE